MPFSNAKIIKAEITREKGQISRIYIVCQMQDSAVAGLREFDYVIDGFSLEEIRANFKEGIQRLLKEQVKMKHQEWVEEISNPPEITNELTPAEIITQLGIDEIKTL